MDDADHASQIEQRERDAAIRRHRFPRPSTIRVRFCAACHERIPDDRLAAMPGAHHCINCQEDEERQ